jgi:cytochrome b involved in lipid metabolism
MENNLSQEIKPEISQTKRGLPLALILAITAIVILAAFAIFQLTGSLKTKNASTETTSPISVSQTPLNESQPAVESATSKTITLSELSQHTTKEDCWLAIEGKVYDVTGFIASGKHPGGEAILQGCGKDATEIFNKRPIQGTSHSQRARALLPGFEIGVLAN